MSTPVMTDDAWQAHATREAAKEIGRWLAGRGRLGQPIAALDMSALESMATAAISRFVVLASERIRDRTPGGGDLIALLYPDRAPSAAARAAGSATPTSSASASTPPTASAPCAASMPGQRSQEGTAG